MKGLQRGQEREVKLGPGTWIPSFSHKTPLWRPPRSIYLLFNALVQRRKTMNMKPTIPYLIKQLAMPEKIVPFVEEVVLLLPGEEEANFLELFSMITIDLDPNMNLEWFTIIDVVSLLWELQRYRRWKHELMKSQHLSAVHEALLKTHPSFPTLGYSPTLEAEVRKESAAWRKDASEAEKLRPRLEAKGYTQDALLAYAFDLGTDTIAKIDHLMASCRRQLSRLIAEAMVRKDFRIRLQRIAAKKIRLNDVTDRNQKIEKDGF